MKPVPLKKGGLISIAAPSGPFDRVKFRQGIALLKKAGFRVSYRGDIFTRKNYLAGDDHRRARELQEALTNDSDAVLFARGGYGCQRILPLLTEKPRAKAVMGSSDLTVLLIHLWKKYRMPSCYGPMVAPHFTDGRNVSRAVRALTDPRFFERQRLAAKSTLKGGIASGRLVGGCLSLIVATLGTPWEIETDGTILFLEDTNEEPYAVDRMLTQLQQAKKLDNVRGLVFGTFKQGKILFPAPIREAVQEKLKNFSGPILWGLRFGHCEDPLLLPFGGEGRIAGRRLLITRGIF